MPLAIGVDAGGTAVRGRTDHDVYTLAEPANARSVGIETTAARILRVIEELSKGRVVDAVHVGAAGAGDPAIAAALMVALGEALPQACVVGVGDDIRIALRAAIDGDGVALIAGTGSIAYAEIGGRRYRAGGYGPLLGDEGSGFAIGAAALRLTLRALDARATGDRLTAQIEREYGSDAYAILGRTRAIAGDASGIAAAAPIVLACAEAGVPSATEVVEGAVADLFALVKSVLGKIGAEHPELKDARFPLALCGGLLGHETILTQSLKQRLHAEFPALLVVDGGDPALGALKAAKASLSHRGLTRSEP